MSFLLHIETSTALCSVAISENSKLLCEAAGKAQNDHAAQLTLLIETVLENISVDIKEISAVCISAGPGSYTGLRIGTSTAKGICHALNIPLLAVDTLLAMTFGALKILPGEKKLFCPMIDARRSEIFYALFDDKFNSIIPSCYAEIEKNIFENTLRHNKILFFGSGAGKLKGILAHTNAFFDDAFTQTAKNLINPASALFEQRQFCDLANFEPHYLKAAYIKNNPPG